MYNTDCGNNRMYNEIAQFAMLYDLFYRIFMWGDPDNIKVGTKHYKSPYEFTEDFKDKPETVRLFVDEYKKEFLYSVADAPEKPATWTPEEYMDWYCRTFQFICDKDVLIPAADCWKTSKYNKDNKQFERIELILANCFESVWEDEPSDICQEYYEQISDLKSFKKACKEALHLYGVDEENIPEYVGFLVQKADDLCKDGDDISELEGYQTIFEDYLKLDCINDCCMYDCDYQFFYDLPYLLL